MLRSWSALLPALAVSVCVTGCIFAVDTDLSDHQPDPDDASLSIDGPDEAVVDPEGFEIDYQISCEPDGCDDALYCRVSGDGVADDAFRSCSGSFQVTDAEVGENDIDVTVQLRDGDDAIADDTTSTRVLFEFDAGIEGLDSDASQPFSHPELGEFSAWCTHPDCAAVQCRWHDDSGDELTDVDAPDCSADTFELIWDEDLPSGAELHLEACSSRFADDHCRRTDYSFHYEEPQWQAAALGAGFGCAIEQDQTLWCWGRNAYGQTIPGGDEDIDEPTRVDFHRRFKDVAAGEFHTCAITDAGQLYCWGRNLNHQFDPGADPDDAIEPVAIGDELQLESVSSFHRHTCAISEDEQLYCFGDDDNYRLGATTDSEGLAHVGVPDGFDGWVQADTGADHTCATARADEQHRAFCWGRSDDGRLGIGSAPDDIEDPTEVYLGAGSSDYHADSISAGNRHSCAVFIDGDSPPYTYCWGHDGQGRLGFDTDEQHFSPQPIDNGQNLVGVTAADSHSCAINEGDNLRAYCWGSQRDGRLGNDVDDTQSLDSPQQVESDHGFEQFAMHRNHTCGITTDADLYCWGSNSFGQLPTANPDSNLIPHPMQWPYDHLGDD